MEFSANTLKYVYSLFVAAGGSATSFLIGEWTQAHSILVTMMLLDFATGLLKGAVNRKLDSKVGYKGLARKGGILVMLIVANLADMLVSDGAPIFVTAVTFFYIAIEALSLLENLEAIGVPLPKKLKEFFIQMRKENTLDNKEKLESEDEVPAQDLNQELEPEKDLDQNIDYQK